MTSKTDRRALRRVLATATALLACEARAAPPVGVPDAGQLLQQVQPLTPPASPKAAPSLEVAPEQAPGAPASAPFAVRAIRIVGNTAFDTRTLHALVADGEGQRLTLAQLQELAGRITVFYRQHGYRLGRALIPAQTMHDGTVTLQVLEARYGKIGLHNDSRVSERLLDATLAPLRSGQPIKDAPLDRALLLASDIPGVAVDAILRPGAEVGTSDLDASVTRRPLPVFYVSADDYGNRYTGRARAGGAITLLNPLHEGDVLSINAVTSGGRMNFGRASYDLLLNGAGTRAGVAISAVGYRLGREVRSLDAHGTAQIASGWVKQPLLRSERANVYAQIEYDFKRLRDRVDVIDARTDRHLNDGVLSLNGDVRDALLGGGLNVWSATWTIGRTGFDNALAQAVDALSARTRGTFLKWNLNASRLQQVTNRDSLFVSFAGQWTNSNLDTAEKVAVGGPTSVRAYDIGILSADTGYFGTIELRHDLGALAGGRWQMTGFVDAARVRLNHETWVNSANDARLAGAGGGLAWMGAHGWRFDGSLAARLGHADTLIARQATVRGWVTVDKAF